MRIFSRASGALGGVAGAAGAAGAFGSCHVICTAAIAVLVALGITVTGMPLFFLMNPNVYIPLLVVGIASIVLSIYLFVRSRRSCCAGGKVGRR